jgi:hypothetical protein
VKVYARPGPGGKLFVRLFGLTQFWRDIAEGKADFDVTVDLETTIAPTEDGYPFAASRMELSGPALLTLDRIRHRFDVDVLTSIRGEGAQLLDEESVDLASKIRNESEIAQILQWVLSDPSFQDASGRMARTRDRIRDAFGQLQIEESGSRPPESRLPNSERFQQLVQTVDTQQPAQASSQAPRKPLGGPPNPFAGAGRLKVNQKEWPPERLQPYLENPRALFPLLTLWRLALQLVYAEVKPSVPPFTVGFIFEDKIRAEYDSKNNRLFSLNPVPVVKLVQAVPDNPAVVAAYLHNKACHEITHALGHKEHDESFASLRERVADESSQVLAPLIFLTENLLDVRVPVTPKVKSPRKKPETKIWMYWDSWARIPKIEHIQEGAKESPIYLFASEFSRLMTEAGYPTNPEASYRGPKDSDVSYAYVTFELNQEHKEYQFLFYPSDFDVRDISFFSDVYWNKVLTPLQNALVMQEGRAQIPLASRMVAFVVPFLRKMGARPIPIEKYGSSNRTPASRQALLAQADAILSGAPMRRRF